MDRFLRLECLRLAAEVSDDPETVIELAFAMWRFIETAAHGTETAH